MGFAIIVLLAYVTRRLLAPSQLTRVRQNRCSRISPALSERLSAFPYASYCPIFVHLLPGSVVAAPPVAANDRAARCCFVAAP
jgi:hypothetical protein